MPQQNPRSAYRSTQSRASQGLGGSSRTSQSLGGSSRASGSAPRAVTVGSSSRSRQVSMQSVRVGDLERAARRSQPRQRRSAPGWLRVFLALALIAALLVVAFYAVSKSDLFPVSEVSVAGVEHLTAAEMAELAAVPQGSTLLGVDTAAIEERLESNPWVESARVRRIFPGTLELAVTERAIAATVDITSMERQQPETWAISQDGMWLMRIPEAGSPEAAAVSPQVFEDAASVLAINDVPYGIAPEVGAYCVDESVVNALSIVSQLTTDLASHVASVSATDVANTLITLDSGVQIAFGTAEDVRDKERVVLALLEEHPGSIAYINVRVVDRPTWRAVPE